MAGSLDIFGDSYPERVEVKEEETHSEPDKVYDWFIKGWSFVAKGEKKPTIMDISGTSLEFLGSHNMLYGEALDEYSRSRR